jgi:hypothetical protein
MGVTFNFGQPRTRVVCNQHLGVRLKIIKPWTVGHAAKHEQKFGHCRVGVCRSPYTAAGGEAS